MRSSDWSSDGCSSDLPLLLPPPQEALKALVDGLVSGPLLFDFWQTIYRTVLSFAIASAIAIPLGVILGAAEKLYRSVEFVIDFFRSTPASAVFPLFLVLFGVGDRTKIAEIGRASCRERVCQYV